MPHWLSLYCVCICYIGVDYLLNVSYCCRYRKSTALTVRGLHKLVIDPLGHCGLHNLTAAEWPHFNLTAVTLTQSVFGIYTLLQLKAAEYGSNLESYLKWSAVSLFLPRYVWMVCRTLLSGSLCRCSTLSC